MHPPLEFAAHPPRSRLSPGLPRLTPCNNAITHQFDNRSKHGAQHDDDDDTMGVDRSHVSPQHVSCLAARACAAFRVILIYFQRRKIIFLVFAEGRTHSENKQTPPEKEKKYKQDSRAPQHSTTRTHGITEHSTGKQSTTPYRNTHRGRGPCHQTGTPAAARATQTTTKNMAPATPARDTNAAERCQDTTTGNEAQRQTNRNLRQHNRTPPSTVEATEHNTGARCRRAGTAPYTSAQEAPRHNMTGRRRTQHSAQQHSTPSTQQRSKTPHRRRPEDIAQNRVMHHGTRRQKKTKNNTKQRGSAPQPGTQHSTRQDQGETASHNAKNAAGQQDEIRSATHSRNQQHGTAQHKTQKATRKNTDKIKKTKKRNQSTPPQHGTPHRTRQQQTTEGTTRTAGGGEGGG